MATDNRAELSPPPWIGWPGGRHPMRNHRSAWWWQWDVIQWWIMNPHLSTTNTRRHSPPLTLSKQYPSITTFCHVIASVNTISVSSLSTVSHHYSPSFIQLWSLMKLITDLTPLWRPPWKKPSLFGGHAPLIMWETQQQRQRFNNHDWSSESSEEKLCAAIMFHIALAYTRPRDANAKANYISSRGISNNNKTVPPLIYIPNHWIEYHWWAQVHVPLCGYSVLHNLHKVWLRGNILFL